MKKAIAVIIAILFALALTTVSYAGEKHVASTAPMEKKADPAMSLVKPQVKTLTGKVVSVDTIAQTIIVAKKMKGKEKEMVITLDEKTLITMGKHKKILADIKGGDKISVQYTEAEGKNIAKNIAIKPVKVVAKKKI